jgi:hypothetical protein
MPYRAELALRLVRSGTLNDPGVAARIVLVLGKRHNLAVEADVALSRCAPSGPRSLTPVVMRTPVALRHGKPPYVCQDTLGRGRESKWSH